MSGKKFYKKLHSISWNHDDNDYNVYYSYTPGERATRDYPGSDPEVEIEAVTMDMGVNNESEVIIELLEVAQNNLTLIDRIREEEFARAEDAYNDEMERRAEARREDKYL